MIEDYFSLKAQLAEIKLKLCRVGLTVFDEPTPRKEIAEELVWILKLLDDLEETLSENPPFYKE
ncbi:hypothetical protein [Bacillus sp. AK031]